MSSNAYDEDSHLRGLIRLHGREGIEPELRAFASQCTELDAAIRRTNRDENLPRLARWDGVGNRSEDIEFHPDHHAIGRVAYAAGPMARYEEPGHELESLALTYLLGQHGEAGHCCPMACTAGLIKILQRTSDPQGWLPRLLDPNYDTHFHGAQFLTEVQGGADVGSNCVVARPHEDGSWRLSGEKYFCSVADAQLMLVTARPEGGEPGTAGLRAFVVPRRLADESINTFFLRRLKYKLGTRSMASAEIDFQEAWAWPVGDFKDTVEIVLNTSRLYNAIVSCGIIHRCAREAHTYARHRGAFGRPILEFPAVARTVATLRCEAYLARGLTFLLAATSDRMARGESDDEERAAWRMLVNLNKFWTSLAATSACRDAIEVLGGNGAIEEFSVLPRLLRDSIVCEQWEGPHNVLCAQVLRDARRLGLHEAMFSWLDGKLREDHPLAPTLARARGDFLRLLAMDDAGAMTHIRDVASRIRRTVQMVALSLEPASETPGELCQLVLEHTTTVCAPGYEPLEDRALMTRVGKLVG
jgi:alkylation response protein AidB-like acyl-CoA dehydrogenase